MSRLQAYYDKISRKYSLNRAIAVTVCFSFYCCIGLFQLLSYFKHHDSFYLFAGPVSLLLGFGGTFQGSQIIHAVVRRLITQAQQNPHSPPQATVNIGTANPNP
ncbi:MAG TPA: hypothetical protein VG225_12820 [Terracidiphilus sp.]|jgi:hypothetical protein|nr:hypothetical protein [Terracidiphilus sp.]